MLLYMKLQFKKIAAFFYAVLVHGFQKYFYRTSGSNLYFQF
jgi:hypothetical protein